MMNSVSAYGEGWGKGRVKIRVLMEVVLLMVVQNKHCPGCHKK